MKVAISHSYLKKLGYTEVAPGKFEKAKSCAKPQKSPPKTKPEKTDLFCRLINHHFNLEIIPEYLFHTHRKWRFDYYLPSLKLAIEVEGGVWTQGRHTRGLGFLGDMEKYNEANLMGIYLYRTTPDALMGNKTLETIAKYIANND